MAGVAIISTRMAAVASLNAQGRRAKVRTMISDDYNNFMRCSPVSTLARAEAFPTKDTVRLELRLSIESNTLTKILNKVVIRHRDVKRTGDSV